MTVEFENMDEAMKALYMQALGNQGFSSLEQFLNHPRQQPIGIDPLPGLEISPVGNIES